MNDNVVRDISRALKPLKNRIHVNRMLYLTAWGIVAAGAASLAVSAVSLFLPVPFLGYIILSVYCALPVISLAVSLFLRPDILKTIRIADSMGLKERLITSYELRESDDPLARAQRQDALKAVSQVDFKSLYKINIPKFQYIAGALLLVLVVLSLLIPSVSRQRASRTEAFIKEKNQQIEEISRQREELSKKSDISPQKLEEMNRKIDELLKELKGTYDEEKAIKALSKARHELESLKSENRLAELSKLGESLMENPLTNRLGQSVKEGNLEDIKQKLEQLKQQLETLDADERKQVEESLKKAAGAVPGNNELAQSLAKLAEAAGSGNPDSIGSGVSNLISAFEDLMSDLDGSGSSAGQDDKAIDDMIASINEARMQISRTTGQGSLHAQGSTQGEQSSGQGNESQPDGQGQGQGQGQGDGQGQGQGQGNNQGNQGQAGGQGSQNQNGGGQGAQGQNGSGQSQGGTGQGNGQGSGSGGGGAGNTSSNGDGGYSGNESGGGSRNPGDKQVKEYESIYVPSRLGGDGDPSYVKGSKGSSGHSQWSQVEGVPVDKGGAVPYESVLGEYKQEAMTRISNSAIPPGMKDIVREYFSSLE